MAMKLNEDGLFWRRFWPAIMAALMSSMVGIGGTAIVFWSDSRAADRETSKELQALAKRMDSVESDAKEARQSAAADRQKTAELAGDMRNVLRSTARIEGLLDRLMMMSPQPPRPERN